MKAILILIVTAGTVQGSSLGPDQTLQIREIEFSTMATCRQAAQQLTKSARSCAPTRWPTMRRSGWG